MLALYLKKLRFSSWIFPLVISLVVLIISIANYEPHTWLTGWDTLHPEFNFSRNIASMASGVWREDQGLGTIAAHSHMSDLPRVLSLYALSLIFPLQTLKYIYVFGCLLLGPLGIYFFLKDVLRQEDETFSARAASFVGALFYLFNLGTVQHFYSVFEMFAVQYAALGWLFLLATRIFMRGDKKNYALFFAASLLATPMAYASLLWFAYAAALGLYLLTLWLQHRQLLYFKRLILIGLISLLVNAFWLLPNLYFIISGASNIPNQSHINQLFSPEAFLHNQAYGNFKDLGLLKNFLFNWLEYTDGSFQPLLAVWMKHLQDPLVLVIGYASFAAIGLGALLTLIKRNNAKAIACLPVLFLGVFMLINQNPPFTHIFVWLRTHLSLFEEGLRFPFTKFSLIYMLAATVCLAVSLQALFRLKVLPRLKKPLTWSLLGVLSLALLLFGAPMFGGQLINPRMRNDIPEAYFSFFTWAQTQPPQTRIAVMPVQTLFGWEHFTWGYEGSGFVWFGIEQPVLVRDFDRWSPYNETFYNQLSTAVYANDLSAFIQTLTQYQVGFILLDEHITSPGQSTEILRLSQTQKLLAQMGATEAWQKDGLHVYDLRSITGYHDFLSAPPQFSWTQGATTYTHRDGVFTQEPSTITSTNQHLATIYPFADLYREKDEGITYGSDTVTVSRTLPPLTGYELILSPVATGSAYTTLAQLSLSNQALQITFSPAMTITTDTQSLQTPSLAPIIVPVTPAQSNLIVEIGDQSVAIEQGATVSAQIRLIAGQPLNYSYFELAKVEGTDDVVTVNTKDIISASLSAQIWEPLLQPQHLPLASTQTLSLTQPTLPISLDISQSDRAANCDLFQRGTISKQQVNRETIYQATNLGAVCDGVNLDFLSTHQAYFLRWQGKNQTGRSPKFYLQNQASDRIDLENLLPTGNYDTTYTIQSWPNLLESGYYLSWEVRSFGPQSSTQSLESITLYPIGLDQLASVRVAPSSGTLLPTDNHVELTEKWKNGTFQYGAHLKASGSENVIVLGQGYDEGWLAFRLPTQKANILAYQLLDHVQYNNWANGWLVPTGEYEIMIVYWPQLLSFAGFGLLFLTAFSLSGWLLIKKRPATLPAR